MGTGMMLQKWDAVLDETDTIWLHFQSKSSFRGKKEILLQL